MSEILQLLSINGTEITEHNRRFNSSESIAAADIELDAGINKRYIRKNKQIFSLSFSYLPNLASKTVDQRAARDFLKTVANTRAKATVLIKLYPDQNATTYQTYVSSYSESLIRRDMEQQCSYYDVSITLEEA